MRPLALALLLLPVTVLAAPTWQQISSEPGKRIEVDRTSLKREEGGKVVALGRVTLEKELTDVRTGGGYRIIEALTRYDCTGRNATTLKRTYRKNEKELLREEELNGGSLPVRAGTLDDKVLREVCRPADNKASATEIAQRASDAAVKLKAANDAMVQKELAKAGHADPVKTADTGGHATAAPAKPEAPSKPVTAAPPAPAPAPAPVPAPPVAAPKPAPSATVISPPARRHATPVRVKKPDPAHAAAEQHAHIHWSYDGEGAPGNWHKLDPKNAACASGSRQSPIDIRDGIRVDLEPIKFDYAPSQFRIIDNGHTIQVSVAGGSLAVGGKTYELVQFHFHRPSEETVNGNRFDMVAHLVHKSDDGKLAVVAVLLERGADNPTIQTLWNHLPLEKNMTVTSTTASIDLNTFLPARRDYYTYMGSLTTPPCSEGVLWLVLKQPVSLSAEQYGIFGRLYRNNARPIQPGSDRLIKESR